MNLIRLFFIAITTLFILGCNQGFCSSGSTGAISSGASIIKYTNLDNFISDTDAESETEASPKLFAIEKNLQKLILEFAKIQGNNSLKNITQSFKKINPDTKSILATYSSLQGQFTRIKKNIIDEGLEKSVRGDIIIPYCDYMIDAIEKKKSAIE